MLVNMQLQQTLVVAKHAPLEDITMNIQQPMTQAWKLHVSPVQGENMLQMLPPQLAQIATMASTNLTKLLLSIIV